MILTIQDSGLLELGLRRIRAIDVKKILESFPHLLPSSPELTLDSIQKDYLFLW